MSQSRTACLAVLLLAICAVAAVSADGHGCTPSPHPALDCVMMTGAGDLALHWKDAGDSYMMGLTGPTAGWVAVGFPSTQGAMIGSKAIQASADSAARVVELPSIDPADFTETTIEGLDTDSLSVMMFEGMTVLTFTMSKSAIPDPAALNLVTAMSTASDYSSFHSAWGPFSVNLEKELIVPEECTPSPAANYDCMMASGVGDIALHWMEMGDHYMMAVTGTSSGWLAVGFPASSEPPFMIGSKAIQTSGAGPARVVELTGVDPSQFAETTIEGLDTDSIAVSQEGGVITLSFRMMTSGFDPAALTVIVAMHDTDSSLSTYHSDKGGFVAVLDPAAGGGGGGGDDTPSAPPAPESPPATDGCTASTRDGYECMAETPIADCTLHWTLAADKGSFNMAVEAASTGWVAVGFPENPGEMIGAEAIFGNAATDVGVVTLVAKDAGSFTPLERNGLSNTQFTSQDGTLLLEFTHDVVDGMDVTALPLIFAVSRTDPSQMWHVPADRAGSTLDLDGGGSSGSRNPLFTMMVVHGALMVLGWATLLPAGVIIAHTMRHKAPLWFKLHMGCQNLGLLATIAALIIALIKFNPIATSGRAGAHAIIGLIVMIVGVLQPINAIFRPHPGEPKRKYWNILHIGAGRLALMLGMVNCFLGAVLFNDYNGGNYEFVIFVAIWVALAVFGFAIFMRTVVKKKDDVEAVKDPENKFHSVGNETS